MSLCWLHGEQTASMKCQETRTIAWGGHGAWTRAVLISGGKDGTAGLVVASGVMTEDACNVGEGDGATLRGRRENGFGREEAQALGEDQSKINEHPRGLVEGAVEGPWKLFHGRWGPRGYWAPRRHPAAPPRSPSSCPQSRGCTPGSRL